MIIGSPTGQSPAAWALVNYVKTTILSKMGESGYRYLIAPWETANGLTNADLTFGFDPGDCRRYGVVGDGVTDDTVKMQKCIDGNKGRFVYVPPGMTPNIGNANALKLIGATYNNTVIWIDGALVLHASPLTGTHNYQSAYVGIAFENVDGCFFHGSIDGNRANQPQDEHIFCIALSGVTNFRSDVMHFREVRGDGLYMDQVAWGTNGSPDCSNVTIGEIHGYNSADDGRNCVSIISGVSVNIGVIHSYQIGGTVNAVVEPGGLDIEPDFGYQNCADINIGCVNVVTGGNQGIGIHGQAITNDATRDWNCERITIGLARVRNTNANGEGIAISRVRYLSIDAESVLLQTAGGAAASIDYADNIGGRLKLAGGSTCCYLGYANTVQFFDFDIQITSYGTTGLAAVGIQYGKLRGFISGAATNVASQHIDITLAGRGAGSITQAHVTYSIDIPYDGKNAQAVTATGVTIGTGTCFRDCNMSGYASFASQITGLSIRSHNVVGRNIQNGQNVVPAAGQWANGDLFWFDTTNSGVPPGAYCTASGAPGTWKQFAAMAA